MLGHKSDDLLEEIETGLGIVLVLELGLSIYQELLSTLVRLLSLPFSFELSEDVSLKLFGS
jgi:hypothetical protein